MTPSLLLNRRRAAAALVALPSLGLAQGGSLRATPRQTEGPFYPVQLPVDSDHDLLSNGSARYAAGEPAWIEGIVTDLRGQPLAGAVVEIWQCDHAGHYHHPGDGSRADPAFQGFGRVTAAADGSYRFRTIRPVAYAGRTPHIHVKVRRGARELLTTQLYVEGDRHNERDGLWRALDATDRRALTVPFQPGAGELRARFPIAVAT